jgi:hypothetical protein
VRHAVGGDLPQQLAERIGLIAVLALNRPVDLAQRTLAQAAISALMDAIPACISS